MAKSMAQQSAKKLEIDLEKDQDNAEEQKNISNINNIICDVSNNINDIINKINNNIVTNEPAKNESTTKNKTGASVSFKVSEDKNKIEKKKIDEEKKELRMSKAMQRLKKNQNQKQNTEGNTTKANKSSKVAEMAKALESKMQNKGQNDTEGNNTHTEVIYEIVDNVDNDNMVNVLQNQKLTKSLKKKKSAKVFEDN